MTSIFSFWWIILIVLSILFYKFVLRVFFGMVIVPEDKIGLVTKKFVLFGADKSLPDSRIIATKGEAGFQAQTLAPGLYWGMWIWQYSVDMTSFTIIPEGKIGLILSKDGKEIPTGRILARKVPSDNFQDAKSFLDNGGQKGRQTAFITTGSYRINTFLFEIVIADQIKIFENMIGIVTALDGEPIPLGQIAGTNVVGHNNFQDFDEFLTKGGNRGLQPQVMLAGSYYINTWAVQIEQNPMTDVPIGYVGVVISYIGEDGQDVTGDTFKHGNIVSKGQRGVWMEPLGPGKYALNKYTTKLEPVPTTNLVLNWADARSESHNLDQNLSTITVRSKDGFPFNLDVSQIIHVPANEAPKVIARFGSMNNLVSQVLEPTIGNYFRNSAQESDVISFLSTRKERQESAKNHIKVVLDEYNVNAVDTLIGDIVPPESLMKTLTDRKIAEEEQKTYQTQKMAQEQRQGMEKETAIADMQKEIVKASQSVEIAQRTADATVKKAEGDATSLKLNVNAEAEATKMRANAEAEATKARAGAQAEATKLTAIAEAERISKTGLAEAEKIMAVGKSTAEAYQLQVTAMGEDNFAKYKITEEIGKGNIKVIPDVLITGTNGSEGGISGLLGMKLMEMMDTNNVNQNPKKK
ncbi:flotillin family protein [Flavobacterium psychrophilum]|uniref:SPFH domain-containing protein n=1 Tax=Flavobacterium psychrophilum TaxID=96345 RepID=UPI00054B77E0|nr:SPFH domain-containing protein [Flavobacterium psychrophilum]EKT2069462.1 flotillin family protein [Flavobacterium psychrophilum]EKT2071725.1 flotillin family protein [Flavobacterium psychrophilum]EKT3963521.1 flotillin family protein [Flavobacterium psychrophilum]EKT4491246.1 flotillin family protein [Flavobacterium psychrophilum]EKT4497618.1 flotillin family protein [Flavobacterium psychrophilum]